MTARFNAARVAINNLTQDELTDLIDTLDALAGVKGVGQRRKGKTSLTRLISGPELTYVLALSGSLSDSEQATLRATALALREASLLTEKQAMRHPVITSQKLRTRMIKYTHKDPITQADQLGARGPYLYYRAWTIGDHPRRGKRFTNRYLGYKALAILYESTEPDSAERRELEQRIINAYHAGTLDNLERELLF
jgi:hypothetical protein